MITSINNKEEYTMAVTRLESLVNYQPGSEAEAEYKAIVLSMKIYNIETYEGSEISSFLTDGAASITQPLAYS